MPRYEYVDNLTGEKHIVFMTISERDEFTKTNPHLSQSICAPLIHSGRGITKKVDQNFKDLLKTIKKDNSKGFTKSTINDF